MRRICKLTLPRVLAVMAFLVMMVSLQPLAQSRGTEAIAPIEFAPGKKMAIVSGSVQRPHGEGDMHNDGADRFSLHYRAGQKISFNLESAGNRAIFTITSANSDLSGLPASTRKWSGRLPKSGDYYLTVWTRTGAARYTMKVSLR